MQHHFFPKGQIGGQLVCNLLRGMKMPHIHTNHTIFMGHGIIGIEFMGTYRIALQPQAEKLALPTVNRMRCIILFRHDLIHTLKEQFPVRLSVHG